MEKIVILGNVTHLKSGQQDEVNKYLEKGWTIKTIHSDTTKDGITVILVLEKK